MIFSKVAKCKNCKCNWFHLKEVTYDMPVQGPITYKRIICATCDTTISFAEMSLQCNKENIPQLVSEFSGIDREEVEKVLAVLGALGYAWNYVP